MLQQLVKLLRVLNSDTNPGQIAAAVAFGLMIGFTPLMSLHNLLVLFLICIFRVNLSTLLVAWVAFTSIAYLLDPVFVQVGESLLLNPDLKPMWTEMYQQDIWRLAHFNNTLTLGSLVVSVAAFIPVFIVSRILVIKYRERILAWVRKTKLMQTLKASKLMQSIARVSETMEAN